MATTGISLDVEYTLGFDDGTTQKVTVGPFPTSLDTEALKQNVIAFNQNFSSDTATLALSKYGAPWNGISKVRVITTDITVFF